jgi:energy-coupling factor transporter transmembrane protein EcfT
MKMVSGNLKNSGKKFGEAVKLRKGLVAIIAIVCVAQIYFVRELLAAEVLFGIGFAVLLAFAGLFYLIGAVSDRGLDWTEAGVRVLAASARRGYASLEDISRKSFRPARSESAQ